MVKFLKGHAEMKRTALLVFAAALSGCSADYLNHYDTVTLAAGDSNRQNSLMQTVDPFNPNAKKTHIEDDGSRAVAATAKARQVTGASTTSGAGVVLPPPPQPAN